MRFEAELRPRRKVSGLEGSSVDVHGRARQQTLGNQAQDQNCSTTTCYTSARISQTSPVRLQGGRSSNRGTPPKLRGRSVSHKLIEGHRSCQRLITCRLTNKTSCVSYR